MDNKLISSLEELDLSSGGAQGQTRASNSPSHSCSGATSANRATSSSSGSTAGGGCYQNSLSSNPTRNMEQQAGGSSSSPSSSSVGGSRSEKSKPHGSATSQSKGSEKSHQHEHEPEDLPQNRIRRSNVCEAWQSTKSCLKERISYLFNNDTLSDVSFLVGRSRVRIPGHKFVLSIGSPVFDAMFNGPLQESERTVELPDVEPEAFLALLKVCLLHYFDNVFVGMETDWRHFASSFCTPMK